MPPSTSRTVYGDSVLDRFRGRWEWFKQIPPGARFQQLYERRQASSRGAVRRFAIVGGGSLLMLLGVVLLPAPGPGSIVIFMGAVLVAQESLLVARALDLAEMRLRRIGARTLQKWGEASWLSKGLLVAGGLTLFVAAGYCTYAIIAVVG